MTRASFNETTLGRRLGGWGRDPRPPPCTAFSACSGGVLVADWEGQVQGFQGTFVLIANN